MSIADSPDEYRSTGLCAKKNALIDSGWDRIPVGTSWWSTTGLLLGCFFVLVAYLWWCGRQYYRAGEGVPAGTVVFGGVTAAFVVVVDLDVLVIDSARSGVAKYAIVLLTLPVPALVVTILVALLPRRLRHAGPRSSSFLRSPACRVLEGVFPVAAVAAGVGGIVGLWFFPSYVSGLFAIASTLSMGRALLAARSTRSP